VKLECYIISHLTFEQIDIELPLSISGPWKNDFSIQSLQLFISSV
jgi:hypothetical protein